MESLFDAVKEVTEPAEWSAGVELSRNAEFQEDSSVEKDERSVRVVQGARDRIINVILNEGDAAWQCDCSLDADPCRHVVATLLAIRQNRIVRLGALKSKRTVGFVSHSFSSRGELLEFNRYIRFDGESVPVASSILKTISEIQKTGRRVDVSDAELRIDHVLPSVRSGILDPKTMRYLIPALTRVRNVEIDGRPVTVGAEPFTVCVEVVEDGDGHRIRRSVVEGTEVVFENGAAIIHGRLCSVEDSALRVDELALLKGEGTFFPRERTLDLASRILPILQGKVRVEIRSKVLPRARKVAPRIEIQTIVGPSGESLTLIPHIIYGEPEIARIQDGDLLLTDPREIPIRDAVEESRLVREVSARLGLRLGEARAFHGESALRCAVQLRGWSTTGDGLAFFTPVDDLRPAVGADSGELEFFFESPRGSRLDASTIVTAWQRGASGVQLSADGGWAALPRTWLEAHGEALARLLQARERSRSIPALMISEVTEVCQSLGVSLPEYFTRLRQGLESVETIPNVELPADLCAELRPYQRTGVNWIAFLQAHGLGALLADDMGLGKTLQALCTVRGRCLIVCPTSVLSSWQQQIARFRPGLKVATYHGSGRSLYPEADITLTSYAILRLDKEKLAESSWDSLILDEAQTIRNPESQVAQAAYTIRAQNRLSLSGTPVENSLEDLWSQCHVLNPGLLGSLREFRGRFVEPIRGGDITRAARLKSQVAPFIMRRLKRDVAKELPPKTEVLLECELTDAERTAYQAVLMGIRGDIVEKIDGGAAPFSILEALLRLRQACCHIGLLPGHEAATSSKIELLLESLQLSIEQGHRALVFSQWTSLLDRIEPHLTAQGIDFCRIDGSTKDRGDIVERFQGADGPPVMLLSLKAGGLGITLTRADHVYIVDPWWNPAVEDQAADRAYRIGQENPVLVHRLVAKDTVEARILELQSAKRALLAAAIGDGSSLSLTRDELLALITT